jgi:hypothetical protein
MKFVGKKGQKWAFFALKTKKIFQKYITKHIITKYFL